jgi:hypothetical protein
MDIRPLLRLSVFSYRNNDASLHAVHPQSIFFSISGSFCTAQGGFLFVTALQASFWAKVPFFPMPTGRFGRASLEKKRKYGPEPSAPGCDSP